MDIEEFVKTSLEQIINGVKEAQTNTRVEGMHPSEADLINPSLMPNYDAVKNKDLFLSKRGSLVHFVEFDIAVTVDATTAIKGNVGLRVMGLDLGGGKEGVDRDSTASRIKFRVPIMLPNAK